MMMKGITGLLVTASLWENVKANDFSYTEANNNITTRPIFSRKVGKDLDTELQLPNWPL
jgi:hypothetical protein